MKAIRFVFCLFAALMLTTLNGLAAEEEDFKTFLQKFTSSASFQYSRIKFPLKSPIALLKDDGETEQTFPFTREKWALLDEETLKEGRTTEEEGGTYTVSYTHLILSTMTTCRLSKAPLTLSTTTSSENSKRHIPN